MDIQTQFNLLAQEFDLKPADYYFLELIPLIEMMWVDGKNQEGEMKILYQAVIEYLAKLDKISGVQAISVAEANDFLARFAHTRPPVELLRQLRELALNTERMTQEDKKNMLDYCLDISAACVATYPYGIRERVQEAEKALLTRLFDELQVVQSE